MNEQDLITRSLRGEHHAFDLLVRMHYGQVMAVVRRLVPDRGLAEEVTQDVFLQAHARLDQFRGESPLAHWLYRIAWRLSLNALRTEKRLRGHRERLREELKQAPERGSNAGAAGLERAERIRLLQLALDEMGGDDQALVDLFYMKELSVEEVADVTGMKADNVRVRLHRARKKLMGLLQPFLKELFSVSL